MSEPILKPLLLAIIAGVGRKTEDPLIEWDEESSIFTVQVDGRDQGRFIGKEGVVFWAINAVLWYAGIRQVNSHARFALLEPKVRGEATPIPFKPNPKWERPKIKNIVELLSSNSVGKENVLGIRITETGHAKADVQIVLDPALKKSCEDPNLAEAIETIISAAGRADGCTINAKVSWGK